MDPAGDAAPVEGSRFAFQTRPVAAQQQTNKAVVVVVVVFFAFVAFFGIFMFVLNPRGAIVFHVRATDVGGLDPAAHGPVIRPSFGLVLRVDNRGMSAARHCWENVTITVFYGGAVVGWGAAPDLCAVGRGSVEVRAAMSHTEVVLTDALRYAMASQLGTGDDLEFEVEMRMVQSGHIGSDSGSRQVFQLCTINPGQQVYSPCQYVHLVYI